MDGSRSRGAHLYITAPSSTGGEIVARSLILEHLLPSRASSPHRPAEPELLLAANCDMQPLPPWHPWHVPFPAMAARMVDAFLKDSRDRATATGSRAVIRSLPDLHRIQSVAQQSDSCVAQWAHPDQAHAELYMMSTVIVENVPYADSLKDAIHHGPDVPGWSEQGGGMGWRPPHLAPNEPWLGDTSTWTEDHLVLVSFAVTMPCGLLTRVSCCQPISDSRHLVCRSFFCV